MDRRVHFFGLTLPPGYTIENDGQKWWWHHTESGRRGLDSVSYREAYARSWQSYQYRKKKGQE